MGKRSVWARLLTLLLLTSLPLAAHGFLRVDVTVEPAGDGHVVVRVVTDRADLAEALVRVGTLAEHDLPAADDQPGWERLAPRLAELAYARLAFADRDGAPLVARDAQAACTWFTIRLAWTLPVREGISARLELHPGHLPPPVYRIERPGAEPEVRTEGEAVALAAPPPPQTWSGVFLRSLVQGVLHVVPSGPDHLLFVLGLWLVATGWRQLLGLVTAFTLAHSLTLALAVTGVVPAEEWSQAVETAIAATLVVVAVEAWCARGDDPPRRRRLRWSLVLVVGLIHGFGFAGALGGLGLPRERLVPALVGFNLGVEGGQLLVLAAATLLLGWTRRFRWHRPAVALPIAAGIAGCGALWAVQRGLG